MNELIKNQKLSEISKEELKTVQGGSPLTRLLAEGYGWLCGTFKKYYEAGAEGAEYGPKY